MQCTRRNFLSNFPVVAVAVSGLIGCSHEKGKVVAVFGDISQSVASFEPYHRAWRLICDHIQDGDRLVLAPITGTTYADFRPLVNLEVHESSWWQWVSESRSQHGTEKQKRQQKMSSGIEQLVALERSNKTDILNALVLASKIFGGDWRHRVLVLCSDMVQDSAELSFYRTHLAPDFTNSFIEKIKRAGGLPDLRKAQVFVVGASAAIWRGRMINSEQEIEVFWRSFVQACGGELRGEHYGPALLQFDD